VDRRDTSVPSSPTVNNRSHSQTLCNVSSQPPRLRHGALTVKVHRPRCSPRVCASDRLQSALSALGHVCTRLGVRRHLSFVCLNDIHLYPSEFTLAYSSGLNTLIPARDQPFVAVKASGYRQGITLSYSHQHSDRRGPTGVRREAVIRNRYE